VDAEIIIILCLKPFVLAPWLIMKTTKFYQQSKIS